MKKMMTLMISLLLVFALCACASAESKGRIAADAAMDRTYGGLNGVSYTFNWANESQKANHYYNYTVVREGYGLTLQFDVSARYECGYGRAVVKSFEHYFDARGPVWDNEIERVWDLVGTYTYKDDKNDYTFRILAVDGETLTVEYDMRGVQQGYYNFPIEDGRLASNGPVTMKVKPFLGDDGSAWMITGSKAPSLWLYPFGRNLSEGGSGNGISFQGFWLERQ